MSRWSRAKLVCCLELSGCRKWPNHFAQKWAQPNKGGQDLSKGMVRAISWVTFTLLLPQDPSGKLTGPLVLLRW